MRVTISRERDGVLQPVGVIAGERTDDAQFAYDAEYLAMPGARALSFSLPLRAGAFAEPELKPYFRGLLPEGGAMEALAGELGLDERDYVRVLAGCGLDCIGDVVVQPDGALPTAAAYVSLGTDDFARLSQSAERSTQIAVQSRLSLAGAQHKCGLYHDASQPMDAGWYRPMGGAASTHILKFESQPYLSIIEHVCLAGARACGLRTAESMLPDFAPHAICVQRFDRTDAGSGKIDKLPVPLRRHQEDFAQALGIAPSGKYAELQPSTAAAITEFIRRESSRPAFDVDQLVRIVIFDYLVGNCDNHLKNLSIMYSSDWSGVRLAPAYDIVATTHFARFSRRMGMRIGGTVEIDDITPRDFALLANQVGVSQSAARKAAAKVASVAMSAMEQCADAITAGNGIAPYLMDDMREDMQPRIEVLNRFAASE